MPLLPARRDDESAGDFTRRRARFALLAFLVALPAALWLFARAEALWRVIAPLEGGPFLLAATAFGGALAIAPIAALVALLIAVWFGVESIGQPRSRAAPLADRAIVAAGLLVWFAPALALVAAAVRAVLTGSIAFSRPAREYLLATDPIAFWQGVGFLLIVAAALAYPAWHYWAKRLRRRPST